MRISKIFLKTLAILILAGVVIFFIPERRNQVTTQHFNFLFSSSISTTNITELANALEGSYQRIGNDLETKPSNTVVTNIYAQRWRYVKATGHWGASGSIEGISTLHFVEQAWGETDSKKVAVHEFAHTVTLKLLLDNEVTPTDAKKFDQKFSTFPVWLWEAISVYEANQFVDPKTLPYLNNGYPNIAELNSRLMGGKIYDCGYTIIEYILSSQGKQQLISLIKKYGNLEQAFNETGEQFCKGWYQFVKDKYLQ